MCVGSPVVSSQIEPKDTTHCSQENGLSASYIDSSDEKYIVEVLLDTKKKLGSASITGFPKLCNISDESVNSIIQNLSKVAFNSFRDKKYVFMELNLKECGSNKDYYYSNLMFIFFELMASPIAT